MKTWTISPEKEELRRKRISENNSKYWLGKKRPDMSQRMVEFNKQYKPTEETKAKMREAHAKRLVNHEYTNPLESRTAYIDVHKWIQRHRGKPQFCEHCFTTENRMYHWANISKQYKRSFDDWLRLCVPCHKRYDSGRSL